MITEQMEKKIKAARLRAGFLVKNMEGLEKENNEFFFTDIKCAMKCHELFPAVSNRIKVFRNYKGDKLDLSKFDGEFFAEQGSYFRGCDIETIVFPEVEKEDNVEENNMVKKNLFGVGATKILFDGCKIKTLDLTNIDVQEVMDMSYMFYGSTIDTLILPTGFGRNVKSMRCMFGAARMKTIDLSSMDAYACEDMSYMFTECIAEKIIFPKDFGMNTKNKQGMFWKSSIGEVNWDNLVIGKLKREELFKERL